MTKTEERLTGSGISELIPAATATEPLVPGEPEWMQTISASKIAAIMGLSPYESTFTLWHKVKGLFAVVETDEMRRGHYLEPGIAAWWADQHPEADVQDGGYWVSKANPSYVCSPDRIAVIDGKAVAVEIKTAAQAWEWGDEGTDEIPPGYRAQVQWQLYVLGLERAYVAVLPAGLNFREYIVDRDESFIAQALVEVERFQALLASDQVPDIDEHHRTYEAIRLMHPEINGETVEVPAHVAEQFLEDQAAEKAAKAKATRSKSILADAMGLAQYAVHPDTGKRVASRRAKGGGTPYILADPKAVQAAA